MEATRKTRLVVAERYPILRLGLRCLTERTQDLSLVAETNGGGDALRLVQTLQPDVLVLSMNLAGEGSLSVAEALREAATPTRTLVLSAYEEETYLFKMLACGVAGYLSKEEAPEVVVQAIRSVCRGEKGWLSRRLTAKLTASAGQRTHDAPLTGREREVLRLVARGYTNRHIAEELFISADTVKNHITHIHGKLGVARRAEAIGWAWRHGLMDER